MIVDSSALIAIARDEPEADPFASSIAECRRARISCATLLETTMVVGRSRQAMLDHLVDEAGMETVAFDAEQLQVAREAWIRFGKGSGSPARLNYGDCFSYALAKVTGEPLLFKGDDFAHTDIDPAS